jgi:phosphoglycolate phosphatase-like HAD superfamily hydrolase
MLRIITDFDGPILDVSERYYRVYEFCLEKIQHPNQPLTKLSKEEFWRMKRACIPESKIGMKSGLDQAQGQEFAQLRRKTIHTQPYLVYDQLAPGVSEALEKVHQNPNLDLVVLTMRRVWQLYSAFNSYNLERFFPNDRCYCLENDYVKTRDIDDKTRLMERAIAELPPASDIWMVGDTEADMIAAKNHGIKAIGVLSGIRDRAHLSRYEPEAIVNNLSEAIDLILSPSLFHVGEECLR